MSRSEGLLAPESRNRPRSIRYCLFRSGQGKLRVTRGDLWGPPCVIPSPAAHPEATLPPGHLSLAPRTSIMLVGCDRLRVGTVPNLWLVSALSDTTVPCLVVNETNAKKVVAFAQKEIRRFFSRYGPSSIPRSTLLHHQGAVPLQKNVRWA
jgi:hypothetical protein